MDNLHLNTAD